MPIRTQSPLGRTRSTPLLAQGFVLLASRNEDPLEHEVRRRLFQEIREYPGLHLSEIARNADVGTNHAKYHLRVLEDGDFVSSQRENGYLRYYPKEESSLGRKEVVDRRKKEWLPLLRRENPLHITMLLFERGQANGSEIGEALDVAPSTVHHHTSKMEEAGLLTSHRDGRSRVYELADPDRVAELLEEHEPPDALVQGFLEGWEELDFP